MKTYDLDSIVKLNKDFYELNAEDFSLTRQSPWPGWTKVLSRIHENARIIDLGCGNGRFFKYISKQLKFGFSYKGLDISEKLIELAKKDSKGEFEVMDIVNNIAEVKNTFNIAVAFGVMHHIPTNELRIKWLNQVAKILEPNGYAILTLWVQQPTKTQIIEANILETGDYILNWDRNNNLKRFVHVFDQHEAQELAKNTNMEIVDMFFDDGKDRKSNIYLILKKR